MDKLTKTPDSVYRDLEEMFKINDLEGLKAMGSRIYQLAYSRGFEEGVSRFPPKENDNAPWRDGYRTGYRDGREDR